LLDRIASLLLTFFATKALAEVRRTALGRHDPGMNLPGRMVADMLCVAAVEVSHPNFMLVLVEGDNPALDFFAHRVSLHPFPESVHAKSYHLLAAGIAVA
jgi:hypothetical protein